jgi:PadR family transcriptional regulator AphA
VAAVELTVTEWAVLGAFSNGATHGFAAARLLAPEGAIGRVWTVSRPLVYRAIGALSAEGLVVESGTAPGSAGPRRRVVRLTEAGERALAGWLVKPVTHVRDYRSELMLKLLLLDGDAEATSRLVASQRAALEPMVGGLEQQAAEASGFDGVLARWRLDSALAAQRFLAELAAPEAGGSLRLQ